MNKLNDVLKNVLKGLGSMLAQKKTGEENEKKKKAFKEIEAIHNEYKDKTLADTGKLDLKRLEYVAPSDDELYKEAERSLSDKYAQKREAATSDAVKKKKSLSDAIEEALKTAEADKKAVDENYGKASSEAENSALKRGVARSSIAQGAINELATRSAEKKQEIDDRASEKKASLKEQLSAMEGELESVLAGLDESEKKEVEDAFSKLKKASAEKEEEVKKYNNSLLEKEKNYALKTFDAPTKERLKEIEDDYEQKKLKIALDYYLSIDDKAAALDEFLGDEQMREYLGSYYDYVSNILRNRASSAL